MMKRRSRTTGDAHVVLEIHSRIIALLRSGEATTRSDLVRLLPASPSLVSLRTRELIDDGILIEGEPIPSSGGRPSATLKFAADSLAVLAADLGTRHARIALATEGTSPDLIEEITIDASLGPAPTLDSLCDEFARILDKGHGGLVLGAVCISLPAPIDPEHRWVESGSRLPGWHHYPIVAHISRRFAVPVLIENDADVMALGEHLAHPGLSHSLTVKAGTSLGVGIVIDSALHRGATGAAGDISHVRMRAFGDLPCACGQTGCLDTVVSGSALTRQWQETTSTDADFEDLVDASLNGDRRADALMRLAGTRLGEALSTVVGFFNPDAVHVSGRLSTITPFLAALRAALYTDCHPLITRDLIIAEASTGADAGVLGGLHLCRQAIEDSQAQTH